MKIAVFLPDIAPEAGGSSTLLSTIKNEILSFNSYKESAQNDEYIFCYKSKTGTYKTFSDFEYINVEKVLKDKNSFFVKVLRKLARVFFRKNIFVQKNKFDEMARREKIDIFWFALPVFEKTSFPYIYTVWDLGHRVLPAFPELLRGAWPWDAREGTYQQMLYRATFIITGNETGKKEILENYCLPAQKIRIAKFPVASFCFGKEKKPDFFVPKDFFVYPAQFWPHKNHARILFALKILQEKNIFANVVFCGSDKGNRTYIENLSKKLGLGGQVIFAGFVSYEELKWLYTHACAMIFASLMGPNNMPPIEAAFLSCPVIISDIAGHREQMKDSALYFNPLSSQDLAQKMELFFSQNERQKLLEKAKIIRKEFSQTNYFSQIRAALEEFRHMRECWDWDYSEK